MGFDRIDTLAKERKPFLFITDFLAQKVEVYSLDELDKHNISYAIDTSKKSRKHSFVLQKYPIDFKKYKDKFNFVQEKIKSGETYMLNLTQPTKITTNLTLKEIYQHANASYKLFYKNQFVCFSPEKFIQIKNNTIHTFPMKGTIDASLPDAKEMILQDTKEMAEHVMVVDLLRNDLAKVAQKVRVEKFRYVETIEAGEKKLLQVSSHICGDLDESWHVNLGTILQNLLPAGSICGSPKKSTLEIIEEVEGYERGFYSGVFGVYDGRTLDSGVMIRFIEKQEDGLVYKSGGGITIDSDVVREYDELLAKVYLP
ncbi:MAG: aminodeoxychorismate synthase component I [Sulfurimonadaceae bacterium]|jgi:para-aminobenzoate synthetase component 1|nr:aminodeoxychorismate synthase component I [Sulfurimonadaceae bacterium]